MLSDSTDDYSPLGQSLRKRRATDKQRYLGEIAAGRAGFSGNKKISSAYSIFATSRG
jgi:hypothetical protein